MEGNTRNIKWMKIIIAIFCIGIISIPINISSIEAESSLECVETNNYSHGSRGTRATIQVPDDYPTIQEAINASFDGDTINVAAGTYDENIVINKSISLIGESSETTTIKGSGIDYNDVVHITANSVYVTEFKITNAGYSSYGIQLYKISNIEIYNCNITDNEKGIRLYNSGSNKIAYNSVSNKNCGIELYDSNLNTIDNNNISNNSWGINFDGSSLNTISNNSIFNNGYGIGLSSSSSLNSIEKNSITSNSNGIDMHGSSLNNEVHYNLFNNSSNGIYTPLDSPVNATYNWWGDASGPFHLTLNPDGKGDKVTDYVVFKPWLLEPTLNYTTDIDSDGMPDLWEIEYDLNPYNESDADLDPDLDSLTNLQEFLNGTNPHNNETDGDSLGDGFEIIFSKTKPNKWDTNGNGIGDGLEFVQNQGYLGWIQSLPDDWIGMTISWENYTIFIKTNSSVLEGEFEKDERKLKIRVAGPNGTSGVTEIDVPKSLCEPEDIEIELDGELINYTLTENASYYHIHIEYNHSVHELVADFSQATEEPIEPETKEKGLPTYLITLAYIVIIILLIIIVVIKIRSGKRDLEPQELPPEKLSILLDKKHDEGKISDETYNDAKSLLEKYRGD